MKKKRSHRFCLPAFFSREKIVREEDEEEKEGGGDENAADAGPEDETAADEGADDASGGVDAAGPAEEGAAEFGRGVPGENDLKDGLETSGGEIGEKARNGEHFDVDRKGLTEGECGAGICSGHN